MSSIDTKLKNNHKVKKNQMMYLPMNKVKEERGVGRTEQALSPLARVLKSPHTHSSLPLEAATAAAAIQHSTK